MHDELVEFLGERFPRLELGHQGGSWIWIFEGEEKVAIDSVSAMEHQRKPDNPNEMLARRVIEALAQKDRIDEVDDPELEPHEDIQWQTPHRV